MATQCWGQPLDQGGEHGPVSPVQAWSRVAAAQDGVSWRSTRNSTFLGEDVRHDEQANPSTCRKIKWSNRNDTLGSCPTVGYRWSRPGPSSGTPPALFSFASLADYETPRT